MDIDSISLANSPYISDREVVEDHAITLGEDDEEFQEDVCRICRNSGDCANPLRCPCACCGSIKYVHQDCLLRWLNHSNALQCEVCKQEFSFSPVYAEDAPSRLPFQELVVGMAMKACKGVQSFFSRPFMHLVWLLIIPFTTFWIWRLAFVRGLGEAQSLFLSHASIMAFITDCLWGFILIASIFITFFVGILIRESVRYFREHEADPIVALVEDNNIEGDQAMREQAEFIAARWQGLADHLKNPFILLAAITIFLCVVIFLPFSLGRVTLHYTFWYFSRRQAEPPSSAWDASQKGHSMATNSRLYDALTLATGYVIVISVVSTCSSIVALIRNKRGGPSTAGRFLGIPVPEPIPTLVRLFPSAMLQLMTVFKVASRFVFELGVHPLICGWWLDVCTRKVFGRTMPQKAEFFSVSPIASSMIHWAVGVAYILQASIFLHLLRDELHLLRKLIVPNPNLYGTWIDDPVHKQAQKMFLSVAVFGSHVVLFVFFPVELALRSAPSIFPLNITVTDPFTEIPVCMVLLLLVVPVGVKHFKLRATVKAAIRHWTSAIGWALGLTDILLHQPGENVEHNNGSDRAVEPEDNRFVARIAVLLVAGWVTFVVFSCALIIIPVTLGNAVFNAVPVLPSTHGVKCNDVYAFGIGSYLILTAVTGIRYSVNHIRTNRMGAVVGHTWKFLGLVLKSCGLLFLWNVVISVLIGLVIELSVIVPIRVPVDGSPVLFVYRDWVMGVIFVNVWARTSVMDDVIPLADERWRVKYRRVREEGIWRLEGAWVLREIVWPIMRKVATALCVPYVVTRVLFPAVGFPVLVNSAVLRYAWLGCAGLAGSCFCQNRLRVWFACLHNSIRDDRYLVGRRLRNFREDNRCV